MKVRDGFVSNSSSSSFMITNKSRSVADLVKFVQENPHLIEDYKIEYSWNEDEEWANQHSLIMSALENNKIWQPGETKEVVFGDEDGTIIGRVFDYMLREGGESDSFSWRFHESLR